MTSSGTTYKDRVAGTIAPRWRAVSGQSVRFIGRRHGRRADRRWVTSWSPEQISSRLWVEFPDDEIWYEAIYMASSSRAAVR